MKRADSQPPQFWKVHGLGNDFVVFDGRIKSIVFAPAQVRVLADRRLGIGGDQILTMLPSKTAAVDLRIQNVDGREVSACGNAVRCIARLIFDEVGGKEVKIGTLAGTRVATRRSDGRISVDLGVPTFDWDRIPLAYPADTMRISLSRTMSNGMVLREPVGVNIGNPHAVFFVRNLESLPIEEIGRSIECDPIFPEGANIGFAEVIDRGLLRLRVWERGAGLTPACATGSAAAFIAGTLKNYTDRRGIAMLDGGQLEVVWQDDLMVTVTGATSLVFNGRIENELWERIMNQ